MTRVALRGLLGRKLRAALTALAIVLGVAMVSGTFVLTDTIDSAFNQIFEESYAGTDAVVSGPDTGISFQGDTTRDASRPGERPRAGAPGRRGRGRRRQRRRRVVGEDSRPEGQGDQRRGSADVRLRAGHEPGGRAVQPAEPARRPLGAGVGRGRDRRHYRGRPGLQRRRHREDRLARPGGVVQGRGPRAVRRRRLPGHGDLRGVRHPDRTASVRAEGLVRRDPGGGSQWGQPGDARPTHR